MEQCTRGIHELHSAPKAFKRISKQLKAVEWLNAQVQKCPELVSAD